MVTVSRYLCSSSY